MIILFGIGASIFAACWLAWMLKHKRTPDRGIYMPSVTASQRPGAYWGEVAWVGFFLLLFLGLLADALLNSRIP